MKIFVWEGQDVSYGLSGGTLVVLAETEEDAIKLVAEHKKAAKKRQAKLMKEMEKLRVNRPDITWRDPEWQKINDELNKLVWLGDTKGTPKIFEIDQPAIIAFNDGGYE